MNRDQFSTLSPLDYRYMDQNVAKHLSENGFTACNLLVELALVKVLNRRKICPDAALQEIEVACTQVTTEEVYAEEKRIKHDMRALVNCICKRVSEQAKPYVHMTATSFDIRDTASALRYKRVMDEVLIPSLRTLEGVLISLTLREAETIQVGRTHGQHAVPITFGFTMASYVSRLGGCIEALQETTKKLRGKFSGAVGAYNASRLFFRDPEEFEREVLAELGLEPAEHSTQIAPLEPFVRLLSEVTTVGGVMANMADDMRNLQRTEIGEVGEEFDPNQVGSSTMPQKQNPIGFENVKSLWKIVVPRLMTVLMDQISEHQRDLTNSASSRTYGEIIAYVVEMSKRLTLVMRKLTVNRANMQRNFQMQKDLLAAEPLQLILASLGHPDAHEKVRQMTLKAKQEGKTLQEIGYGDGEIQEYIGRTSAWQVSQINDPARYTGIAAQKARSVAENWKKKLGL